jgi:hypothetical protein
MANDLATLKTRLATQLRDTDYAVWGETELEDLLTDAAAQIWPRVAATVREPVTLVANQSEYTLEDVASISRVDVLDSDDALQYHLPGGTWEFWADQETIGGTLYINPSYATSGNTLRVHGYAPYDLATTLPPDRVVPLIQAKARAEAFTRMLSSRAQFENWQSLNQKESISINELGQMIAQALSDADRLEASLKTWRRPVPAR